MSIGNSPGVVTIAGLTFNETDANGVEWVFDALDGWHDGPSVSVDQADRIVSHGIFSQPGHRGGRVITLAGWVYADDRALVAAAVDSLTALLADGSSDMFTFIDADLGSRWVNVQLLATPDIAWDADRLLCKFQLQFLAADPYRYGATSSASTGFASTPEGAGMVWPAFPDGFADFGVQGDTGTVTVSNPGSASASVLFRVAGPTPDGGFVITDASTGEPITYLGAVPVGSTLVLDGSDGSVVIDGTADRLGDTIVTSWPSIPRGASRDFLFAPLGGTTAAVLTAEVTATYW
jgi:hypothetical protein